MHTSVSARKFASVVYAAAVVLAISSPAHAGPPLICQPFDTGSAALLPWAPAARGNWNSPDLKYDVKRLTDDTLELLSADAPILARMENLRRATIYAARDPQVAADLLRAVTGRVRDDAGRGVNPLAWFDAGYLIESYRQASPAFKWDMLSTRADARRPLDGYAMLTKALRSSGSPEMEFAASLMKSGPEATAHRQRAAAGAGSGSLLARNLAMH